MTIYLRIGIFLWVLLQGGLAFGGETAKEIQRLLDAGKVGQAYELGLARSAKEAGDPEFDFLFALTAIQVGHPEQAVFALERILFLHPENDRVRLELARAHFMLGNYPEARTQFEIVLTHRPPQNVQEKVKLFLEKIREQERAVRPVYNAYTTIRAGHDTNINSATSNTTVTVPVLGLVTLVENAIELEDDFVEVELGGEALRPISKKRALFGRVGLRVRDNIDTDEFDTDTLNLRGGISFLRKRSIIRVPLQFEYLNLDGENFRNLLISGVEWERPIKGPNWVAVFGQLGRVEYPDQDFRDVDLALVGGAWTHRFGRANRQVKIGVYVGDEDADDDEPGVFKKHNGRDYVGVFGDFQWNLAPRHAFFVSGQYQSSEYDAEHPVFGEVRDDDFLQLATGWNWRWRPKWTINIQLNYSDNDSNIELFSYDRTELYAGLRFTFY